MGLQKSYKDLIRKLERKDMIGLSQPSSGSIGEFTANSSQCSINESNLLKELMNEAHELYKNVQGPHEARLDARVLKEVSKICRLRSYDLSVNQQKFQVSEFADKLIQLMGGSVKNEDEDPGYCPLSSKNWSRLGNTVHSIVNTTPHLKYLLGSMHTDINVIQPKKKATPRARNESSRPATEAKVVDFTDKNSPGTGENMTDIFVESTYKQLCIAYTAANKEPICYFSFVLDPSSFGKTVENMFYTSFLIKEAKAKIYFKQVDDSNKTLPVIIPLKRRKHEDGTSNNLDDRKQLLMTISIEEWIRLKNVFQRTSPMIIHERNSSQ